MKHVLASDRGPRAFAPDLQVVTRSGSVTALLTARATELRATVEWISPAPDDGLIRGHADMLADFGAGPSKTFTPLLVGEQVLDDYYYAAGATMLWPTLHGRRAGVAGPPALAAYVEVNRLVAQRIDRAAADVIEVHDYQLGLVPSLLERREDRRVEFFLHTSFDAAAFATVPVGFARRWLASLLSCDEVGFQSTRWREQFREAVRQQFGSTPTPTPKLTVSPVSPVLDAETRRQASTDHPPAELNWDPCRNNVVAVSRLDPVKNVCTLLKAWGRLLDERSSRSTPRRLTCLLVPSRLCVREYREYHDEAIRIAEEIRRRHPGSIILVVGEDRPRALWALAHADVVVANSVRDGWNLVVHECVELAVRPVVVVLSEGLGVYDLLADAAVVITGDATDVDATTDALHSAVTMPDAERRRRYDAARRAVASTGSASTDS